MHHIEIQKVNFEYQGANHLALDNVNLSISRGSVVLLCGKSGCGKTSITRLINGLIPEFYDGALSGNIFIYQENILQKSVADISAQVGSVFQNPKAQFFNLNTSDELTFACQNKGLSKEFILQKRNQVIQEFGIHELMDRSIFSLSGGEAQKIACASVSCLEPDIIVLDEPSSNLDAKSIQELRIVLKRWKDKGKTLIISEHRLYYLLDIADHIIYLNQGRIDMIFTPQELFELPLDEYNQLGLRARSLQEIDLLAKNQYAQQLMVDSKATGFLSIKELQYFSKKNKPIITIKNITLHNQHIYALVGNNGEGKSTFLKSLAGLNHSVGQLEWHRKSVKAKYMSRLAYLVMQDVNHQLFTESLLSEVLLSMRKLKLPLEQKKDRALSILQALNLSDFIKVHPMNLSGGQKQRLAVASAIASEKPIILFDEPTSGLDYQSMLDVAQIIQSIAYNRIIVIATHDPEFIRQCATDIMFFEQGTIKNIQSLTQV
ncbi:MAG: ATP-binding cassette domain-containing protein [Neisseriaceae bacterium]|nr:MAG: ATP-binding cassette domain-containing protein [Neisseriaceae bacterium]